MAQRRPSFLDQEAPPGYIAGIGRGAAGFTTRSDVGSARLRPRGIRGVNVDSDDDRFMDDADDDGEDGYGDREDEEADAIFKAIDDRLKLRNNKKKRVRIDEVDESTTNMQRISNQFVDLKKDLSSVSETQWATLPEVGDLTKRNKRLRQEASRNRVEYAAPDSLISGLNTSASIDSTVDIGALTMERERLLKSKIDANFDVDDENVADDYLKELPESNGLDGIYGEEADKIATILNAYTKGDSKSPDGWIARARFEESRKNFDQARKSIQKGCTNCPKDEGIWLENVRLNQHDLKYCKVIITEAIKFNGKSLRLWLKAMDLEQESFNKKRILRKALEKIPLSEPIWSTLMDLEEDDEDRRKIAEKALELIPSSESIWLRLIDMQVYKDAKTTLNKARKALGGDNVQIWLKACRLEFENNPESDKVDKLIKKAFKECVQVTRDEWFGYAINFETMGSTYLTQLIVTEILTSEDEDYEKWVEDSKKYEENIYVLKTILNQIVIKFPKKTAIWRRLIQLYKNHFNTEEVYKIFENIVQMLPKNPMFWLMYSKEVWKSMGDLPKAKEILLRALKGPLPTNTDVWCALIKLETVDKNFEKVQEIFEDAKEKLHNERIWIKWVTFQRQQGDNAIALRTVNEGLGEFVDCWKMYLQKAQILEEMGDLQQARLTLALGTRQVPSEGRLWIALSRIDEKLGNVARARSDLDSGVLKVKEGEHKESVDQVWLERLELEKRSGNLAQVGILLTKAKKECPTSSLLWTFHLKNETKKSVKKTLPKDALTATQNHVRVLVSVGVQFWLDGKLEKAQRWFERALLEDDDYGDAWAWNYIFMTKSKRLVDDKSALDKFLGTFTQVEPRHGDVWPVVVKRIENLDKEPVELLKLVSDEILKSIA